jgi:predicted component of type VI protein secretion system
MTEDEINRLADILADKVMDRMESKQLEWDIEFQKDIAHFNPDLSVEFVSEKQALMEELEELTGLLSVYMKAEQYEKCSSVEERINVVRYKIDNLKK